MVSEMHRHRSSNKDTEISRHFQGLRYIREETKENRIFLSRFRVPDVRLRRPATALDYSLLSICLRSTKKIDDYILIILNNFV